jgi:hypothetical protein
VGVIVVIFKSRACLSCSQPIEIELLSEDLVEAFQDNGEFNTYLSEKPSKSLNRIRRSRGIQDSSVKTMDPGI